MWGAVAIIGLAAITSLSRLLHYITSIESQDKNQNKAGCTEQEEMMTNLVVLIVLIYPLFKLIQESLSYNMEGEMVAVGAGCMSNSNPFDAPQWSIPTLRDVMEALNDPNTHLIGVYGSDDEIKYAMLQKVYRRVQRDQLFGMIVTATVTKRLDVKKIQEDIADKLGFTFNQKSKAKRAKELIDRIKNEQKILIVLCDAYKGLDLSMVGIPYGADHNGCKILLTSPSEDVLSNHIHTQKNIRVI